MIYARIFFISAILLLGATITQANEPHFRIMLSDVEAAVAEGIVMQTELDEAEVTITSERNKTMHSAYRPVYVEIATLNIDDVRKQWSANMVVKDDKDIITARPISGRYEAHVLVPTLKSRIKHGMVIKEDDIVMDTVASAKVRANTVTDASYLIGKTAKRAISAHRSVRMDEVKHPKILEMGHTVTMKYKTAYMSINAVGEALEAGGIGDVIRVRNHDSNKVIRARIMSKDEVDASI